MAKWWEVGGGESCKGQQPPLASPASCCRTPSPICLGQAGEAALGRFRLEHPSATSNSSDPGMTAGFTSPRPILLVRSGTQETAWATRMLVPTVPGIISPAPLNLLGAGKEWRVTRSLPQIFLSYTAFSIGQWKVFHLGMLKIITDLGFA